MRHLRSVPDEDTPPPQLAAEAGNAAGEPVELPAPSPTLAAKFRATDELMDGLSQTERRRAAETLYYDADGQPSARSLKLRLT